MRLSGTSANVKTYDFARSCRKPLQEFNIDEFTVFYYDDSYNGYSIQRQYFVFAEIFSDFYEDAREVVLEYGN